MFLNKYPLFQKLISQSNKYKINRSDGEPLIKYNQEFKTTLKRQMFSEFAYAKLQSIHGQEYFIHNLPALLASKRCKEWSQICQGTPMMQPNSHHKLGNGKPTATNNNNPECLSITGLRDTFPIHGIIFHCDLQNGYRILPLTTMKINDIEYPDNEIAIEGISQCNYNICQLVQKEYENSVPLSAISKLTILSSDPRDSQVYYFCLPMSTPQRTNPKGKISSGNSLNNPSSGLMISSLAAHQNAPLVNGSKWSNDDHQQLKKLLLQYGYGRWKQIQRSSASLGGKLDTKILGQVKAYANSFLRALGLSLPEDQTNLKIFLQKLIEENNQQFQEYQPSLKQWDQHIQLPQRSIQYTKRLQLLHRVRSLIKKYRDEQLKKMTVRDRRKVNWDSLLNFIPLGLLFGQRPAVWWAKKHDVDLLLGIYKYGYANYISIRNAKEYCFAELERSQSYQDLPVADNLTRRLKKLINTIVKIHQNQGEIDFDDQASSEEDQKTWSDIQKRSLLAILTDYGVPIAKDNRSNWPELKDKVKTYIKDFSKTPAQVEKMVSRIRWNCQEIISDEKLKEEVTPPNASNAPFRIYFQQAVKFCRNINILQFVRRSILAIQPQNFKTFLKEASDKNSALEEDHPAFIKEAYQPMKAIQSTTSTTTTASGIDQLVLNHINKSGITPLTSSPFKLNQAKVFARVQWLCQIFRQVKQKLNDKKKKYKTFDESTKKRGKFEIIRDKQGNIKFPINVNPSLILVATGRICIIPNYHSEHNLFPIGYIAIRSHASMFTRGVRAKYRCQILQGEGRPIYKVTSEQDPDSPIVRDSSTGCWVHICQKVNNLQENKKEKVTISGTQRFGLLESNVIRLLEDLTEAEKCTKYKFKKQLLDGGNPN